MITFKQFITEDAELDIKKFQADCAPILKILRGGNKVMWHGTENGPDVWAIRQWKERSGPRDSRKEEHDAYNKLFVDMFGEPIRNWMFVTSRFADAALYSGKRDDAYAIFPIGNFEWVQGQGRDLKDLTGWHTLTMSEIYNADTSGALSTDQRSKMATDFIVKKMRNMKWRHNTALKSCLQSENEIMIKCDKFYMIAKRGPLFQYVMDECDIT
jgi:hypothetical protein